MRQSWALKINPPNVIVEYTLYLGTRKLERSFKT